MKNSILAIALLLAAPNISIAAPIPAPATKIAQASWYTYTAQDGSYTVKFPQAPTERSRSIPSAAGELTILMVGYQDQEQKSSYITTSVTFPVKPSDYDVQKGLDGAREGLLRGTNGKITEEKNITLNGLPGREIAIEGSNGTVTRVRVFIDPQGPTLYQAVFVSEGSKASTTEASTFLNSLNIPK